MPDKVIDGGIWSLLGFGWLGQIDWVFLSGLLIGIATLIARCIEIRAKKRESDLKESDLDLRKQELEWDKEKHAIDSNKTPKGQASIKKKAPTTTAKKTKSKPAKKKAYA